VFNTLREMTLENNQISDLTPLSNLTGMQDLNLSANQISYWLRQLNGGTSRLVVLAGFVNANEFGVLCADYGITRGGIDTSNEQIAAFVTRFYEECLDRSPDQSGLDDWVDKLASGELTGADVAYGFVYSIEFQAQVLTD